MIFTLLWAVPLATLVPGALAVIGLILPNIPLHRLSISWLKRKPAVTWWALEPLGGSVDPAKMTLAVAMLGTSKSRIWGNKKQSVTIARQGTGADSANLWLGVAGASDPTHLAETIGHAANFKLGKRGAPPLDELAYSKPWMKSEPLMQEGEIVTESHHGFGEQINHALKNDEWLVITTQPNKSNSNTGLIAAAMSTSPIASVAWAIPAPKVSNPPPHKGLLSIAVTSASTSIFSILAMITNFASHRTLIWYIFQAVILGMCFWVWREAQRTSRALKDLAQGDPVEIRSEKGRQFLKARRRQYQSVQDGALNPEPAYQPRIVPAVLPSEILAGWLSGGDRIATQATERLAPDTLTREGDCYLGTDKSERPVFTTTKDRQFGILVTGDAGYGKTVSALNVLASDARLVAAGDPRTLIWIETKGEGRSEATQVMEANGLEPLLIRAASLDGPKLELVEWENPERGARILADAVKHSLDPGDVYHASYAVFTALFRAVLGMTAKERIQLGWEATPDVMTAAFLMADGDPANKSAATAQKALRNNPHYKEVDRYMQMTQHERNRIMEPPRNKLKELLVAKGLWEAGDRPCVTFADILTQHAPIVIDLSPGGDIGISGGYSDRTANLAGNIIAYCLWNSIKSHCDSWQKQGKSVAIYSDEVADLAGNNDASDEVVALLMNQGRSRGVLNVFATQRTDNIPRQATREALNAAGTRLAFRSVPITYAEHVSRSLHDQYSPAEISAMKRGECAARVNRDGAMTAAFTLLPDAPDLLFAGTRYNELS